MPPKATLIFEIQLLNVVGGLSAARASEDRARRWEVSVVAAHSTLCLLSSRVSKTIHRAHHSAL